MQYWWRYIQNERTPPAWAMKIGSWFHRWQEAAYKKKLLDHQAMTLTESHQVFADEVDRDEELKTVKWAEEMPHEGAAKDMGIKYVLLYHEAVYLPTEPLLVEQEIVKALPSYDITLKGIVDLQDSHLVIRDSKTRRKTPPANLHLDPQLNLYQVLLPEATGIRQDNVVVAKTEAKLVPYSLPARAAEQMVPHLESAAEVAKSISAGIFMPTNNAYTCNELSCGYFAKCKFGASR